MAESTPLDDRESDFILKQPSETVVFQPNHALIARPRLREKDMRPQRVFFYKRLDNDQIMVLTEQEASLMIQSSHRFLLRQIGCSDGTTYLNFIRNCGLRSGQVVEKSKAEQILKDAFNAELEAARGHFDDPQEQNVHFDGSFPLAQRSTFIPPK